MSPFGKMGRWISFMHWTLWPNLQPNPIPVALTKDIHTHTKINRKKGKIERKKN